MSEYVTISIPESLYRRARDLARLNRQTVNAVIAEALDQAFPVFHISPEREKMEQEQAAYMRLRESLLATHEGQYVAIHGGRVVDADPDEATLAIRVSESYPGQVVHIRQVNREPERDLVIRSPRLVD